MAAADFGKGSSDLPKMQKRWKKNSGWVKEAPGNLQTGMCIYCYNVYKNIIVIIIFFSTCLSSEPDFVESFYMSTLWETTENFNWNEVPPHGGPQQLG